MRYFCPSAIFGYLGGQMGDKMGDNPFLYHKKMLKSIK